MTGETVIVVKELDRNALRAQLQRVFDSGVRSLAVALTHSYTFRCACKVAARRLGEDCLTCSEHENAVGEIAKAIGFSHISLSSAIMPMVGHFPLACMLTEHAVQVKIVPRGFTAAADAYLTPCIQRYLETFVSGFDANLHKNTQVLFMQASNTDVVSC